MSEETNVVSVENVATVETEQESSVWDTRARFRLKTNVLEELHLSKKIEVIPSVVKTYKRNKGYVENTVYYYKASVINEDSPYNGMIAFSNSENDAINKLNDLLYEKAQIVDVLLVREVQKCMEKKYETKIKKAKAKAAKDAQATSFTTAEKGKKPAGETDETKEVA